VHGHDEGIEALDCMCATACRLAQRLRDSTLRELVSPNAPNIVCRSAAELNSVYRSRCAHFFTATCCHRHDTYECHGHGHDHGRDACASPRHDAVLVATHDFVDPLTLIVDGVTLSARVSAWSIAHLTLMSALTCLVSCILQHTRMCKSNLCL
jgi:hypothetical protein